VAVENSYLQVTDADSGRRLVAWIHEVGEDLIVAVGGGERPHVGSVVLAQPYRSKLRPGEFSASCSVLTIPPHKEEPLARGIAVRLAKSLGKVVVVTAGVHENGLEAEGVTDYLRLGNELGDALAAELGAG